MKKITKAQIDSAIDIAESSVNINPENKKLDYEICYEDGLKDAIIYFKTTNGDICLPLIPKVSENKYEWTNTEIS